MVNIEVVYALPEQQTLLFLTVPEGTSAGQAIELSGLLTTYLDIDLQAIGIFGRIVPPETIVQEGDRVEIYRPLIIDPMEARRARAKKQSAQPGPAR